MHYECVECEAWPQRIRVQVLAVGEGDNSIVACLVEGLLSTQEQQGGRDSNQPCQKECDCLIAVRRLVSDVLAVSDILRSMVEIRVLTFNIGEGVMSYNVLVHPGVGGTKHKADIHTQFVHLPVPRVTKVACVVIYVHGPNPKSDWHGEDTVPRTINVESFELGERNSEEDDTLDNAEPGDLDIVAQNFLGTLFKLQVESGFFGSLPIEHVC